jgi:hypothetical protein
MEKYSLNEGNESLKRVLLMMGYDNNKTLADNTKNIFEQDTIPVVNQDEDNALDPKIVAKAEQSTGTNVPSSAEIPNEVRLSYEDTVKKLQNLLITKYQANLGKYGADGKIGPLTLAALNNAIKTKVSQTVTEPPKKIESGDDKKTNTTTPDNQITPESNVSVAVNTGSIDDWA